MGTVLLRLSARGSVDLSLNISVPFSIGTVFGHGSAGKSKNAPTDRKPIDNRSPSAGQQVIGEEEGIADAAKPQLVLEQREAPLRALPCSAGLKRRRFHRF